MIAAILDLETTSLSIAEAKIIELAIVVYDTSVKRVVYTYSSLVDHENLYVPQNITDINGITTQMCKDYGDTLPFVMSIMQDVLKQCDCVIAQNGGGYDYQIIERDGYIIPTSKIDSKTDIKWPQSSTSKRLLHLAADYGCTILSGHQALNDCLMLLDLLNKKNAWQDIERLIGHRSNKLKLVHTDKTNLW